MLESKKTRNKRGPAGNPQAALELKAGRLTLMVLHVYSADHAQLAAELDNKVAQAPSLFQNAPLIVDLSGVKEAENGPDLAGLSMILRRHGITPLGVRGGNTRQRAAAAGIGLPLLPESKLERPREEETAVIEEAPPVSLGPAKIITQPVRSGQQVVSREGDLIVLSMVSPGAEILAAGHIHVYGPLRGRALAGVNGDTRARIFCQQLYAELVAVAGEYQISEEFDNRLLGKAVQIYLDNDQLKIETF